MKKITGKFAAIIMAAALAAAGLTGCGSKPAALDVNDTMEASESVEESTPETKAEKEAESKELSVAKADKTDKADKAESKDENKAEDSRKESKAKEEAESKEPSATKADKTDKADKAESKDENKADSSRTQSKDENKAETPKTENKTGTKTETPASASETPKAETKTEEPPTNTPETPASTPETPANTPETSAPPVNVHEHSWTETGRSSTTDCFAGVTTTTISYSCSCGETKSETQTADSGCVWEWVGESTYDYSGCIKSTVSRHMCTVHGTMTTEMPRMETVDEHDYVERRTEPTCECEGWVTVVCSKCGTVFPDKSYSLGGGQGHTFVETARRGLTEEEAAWYEGRSACVTYTCSTCGFSYEDIE